MQGWDPKVLQGRVQVPLHSLPVTGPEWEEGDGKKRREEGKIKDGKKQKDRREKGRGRDRGRKEGRREGRSKGGKKGRGGPASL